MGVQALLLFQQRLVRAAFHNAVPVHDDDPLRVPHGAQAVGNDEHGAPLADMGHVAPDDGFAFVVERAAGFVEDEDARLVKQRACNGDALALTSVFILS